VKPELQSESIPKHCFACQVPDEAGRHQPPKGKRKADAMINAPDAKSGPSKRPAKSSEALPYSPSAQSMIM